MPPDPSLIEALVDGRVQLGLTATLYFKPPFPEDVNERLCLCIEEFLAMAPGPPKLGGLPGMRHWVGYSKKAFKAPGLSLTKLNALPEWDLEFLWSETDETVDPWSLTVLRRPSDSPRELSYLHVFFPLDAIGEEELPHIVKEWSERLAVFHGYVGHALLSPSEWVARSKVDGLVFAAAKKFPGLNVDDPTSHSVQLEEGIKTVDWLTLLGTSFVDKLGGVDVLAEQLQDFDLTRLSTGGLLIRTGERPQMGGEGAEQSLRPYIELNRILKPIRVVDYPWSFQSGQAFQSGWTTEPYMDRAASQAWIARFDAL